MQNPLNLSLSDDLHERAKAIKLLVLDVDGVMTDGGLIQGDDGQEYKRFHARDGLGLRMLRNTGLAIAIISGRSSKVVRNRAKEIGAIALQEGCHEKDVALEAICSKQNLALTQVAFMGDDIIDIPAMLIAGMALSVPDAHALVLQQAHWTSTKTGGNGAVRDACEMLMTAQGTLTEQLKVYKAC